MQPPKDMWELTGVLLASAMMASAVMKPATRAEHGSPQPQIMPVHPDRDTTGTSRSNSSWTR